MLILSAGSPGSPAVTEWFDRFAAGRPVVVSVRVMRASSLWLDLFEARIPMVILSAGSPGSPAVTE